MIIIVERRNVSIPIDIKIDELNIDWHFTNFEIGDFGNGKYEIYIDEYKYYSSFYKGFVTLVNITSAIYSSVGYLLNNVNGFIDILEHPTTYSYKEYEMVSILTREHLPLNIFVNSIDVTLVKSTAELYLNYNARVSYVLNMYDNVIPTIVKEELLIYLVNIQHIPRELAEKALDIIWGLTDQGWEHIRNLLISMQLISDEEITITPINTFMKFAQESIIKINGKKVWDYLLEIKFNAKLDPLPLFNIIFYSQESIGKFTKKIEIGCSLFVDTMITPVLEIPVLVPGFTLDFEVGGKIGNLNKKISFHINPNPFSLTDRSYTLKGGLYIQIEKHAEIGGQVGIDGSIFVSIDDKTVRKAGINAIKKINDAMNEVLKGEFDFKGVENGVEKYTTVITENPLQDSSLLMFSPVILSIERIYKVLSLLIPDLLELSKQLGIEEDIDIGVAFQIHGGIGVGLPEAIHADLVVEPKFQISSGLSTWETILSSPEDIRKGIEEIVAGYVGELCGNIIKWTVEDTNPPNAEELEENANSLEKNSKQLIKYGSQKLNVLDIIGDKVKIGFGVEIGVSAGILKVGSFTPPSIIPNDGGFIIERNLGSLVYDSTHYNYYTRGIIESSFSISGKIPLSYPISGGVIEGGPFLAFDTGKKLVTVTLQESG